MGTVSHWLSHHYWFNGSLLLCFRKDLSFPEQGLKVVGFFSEVGGCNPSNSASLVAAQSQLKFKEVANKMSAPAPWPKSAETFLFTCKTLCLGNSIL